jgi:hypothetical protein
MWVGPCYLCGTVGGDGGCACGWGRVLPVWHCWWRWWVCMWVGGRMRECGCGCWVTPTCCSVIKPMHARPRSGRGRTPIDLCLHAWCFGACDKKFHLEISAFAGGQSKEPSRTCTQELCTACVTVSLQAVGISHSSCVRTRVLALMQAACVHPNTRNNTSTVIVQATDPPRELHQHFVRKVTNAHPWPTTSPG